MIQFQESDDFYRIKEDKLKSRGNQNHDEKVEYKHRNVKGVMKKRDDTEHQPATYEQTLMSSGQSQSSRTVQVSTMRQRNVDLQGQTGTGNH